MPSKNCAERIYLPEATRTALEALLSTEIATLQEMQNETQEEIAKLRRIIAAH
ncbi:MAG: hypothetical protein NVS4B9_10970 [Ktedonobacteraceae bacterium]